MTVQPDGVQVTVRGAGGPREFHASYLARCDGRRSLVRDAAGIGYHGTEDTITCVIGDVPAVSATAAGFAGARAPWDMVGAALIRPDGHLAWAGGAGDASAAAEALRRWLPGS